MIRKQSRKIFCRPKRSDSQPNTTLPKKIPSNAELPIHRYERVTDRAERETFGKVRTERQPGDLDVKRSTERRREKWGRARLAAGQNPRALCNASATCVSTFFRAA